MKKISAKYDIIISDSKFSQTKHKGKNESNCLPTRQQEWTHCADARKTFNPYSRKPLRFFTAAVCSGAYCLSSNIWNPPGSKADCGGLGWIISPEGDILAETDTNSPFATIRVDLEYARSSKNTYPRYVPE